MLRMPEAAGGFTLLSLLLCLHHSLAVSLSLCGEGKAAIFPTFLSIFDLCSPTLPLEKVFCPLSNWKLRHEKAPPSLSGRLGPFVLCPSAPLSVLW